MGFSAGTMAMAGTMTQAAGVGMSAVGSYNQASAQRGALNYEAGVNANNAKIADWQAGLAEQNGAVQEENQRLKTAAMFGTQRAALGANGVDLGSGSANEVLATTGLMGERDALTIRDNAARQAWAYRNQATGYLSEAATARSAADAINPTLSAGGSLLTGVGTVASSWYKYNRAVNGTPAAPVASTVPPWGTM